MLFSEEESEKLKYRHYELTFECLNICTDFIRHQYKCEKSLEYVTQGISRRVKIIEACIDNIYEIAPLNQKEKLSKNNVTNLNINLHAFFINIYGVLDNLSCIYLFEKDVKDIDNINIGLRKKQTTKHFSENIKTALENKKDWLEYIENFRHALAHRIAPYVPPYRISEEDKQKYDTLLKQRDEILAEPYQIKNKKNSLSQQKIDKDNRIDKINDKINEIIGFCYFVTHSFTENPKYKYICFQSQVLDDWYNLIYIIKVFMSELDIKINENSHRSLPFDCWKSSLNN